MEYQLDIKENALDSFNEALAKFELGQSGEIRQFKFSILHLSHFLELVLKLYITSVDENILFSKCFRHIEKRSKKDSIDLLKAYQLLCDEEFDFESLLNEIPFPHTITLDQALAFSKCEKCSITDVAFVDIDFCKDIEWIKGLRNNIEHYQFRLSPKEARLCIGRLVRGAAEFIEIFDLFNLESEVGEHNYGIFSILADEYTHLLNEAEKEVEEKEAETFLGVRHKFYALIEWNVYECPECSNKTMIPSETSSTGYKCTFCENEESDEIEIPCDCCGSMAVADEMATWQMDDGSVENRCYFCSGQYYADKDD
ncbi:hypothetical protein DXF93_23780 [Escherichia coli]|nr:hypothetical protein DXF93_23780 [Escherichia coli]